MRREKESRRGRRLWSARRRIPERLASSPWVYRLARLGFAAKGLLYVIAGATAALAVVRVGGRPVGTRGALNLLAGQPFGRAGLALVAVGLGGFILRRLLQIFVARYLRLIADW